jgi:hypothetical protein
MADPALLQTSWAELDMDKEASWNTRGPHSEGVRLLVFARGHVWDVDGTDWRFAVVGAWTPDEFIAEWGESTGAWGEVVAWLRARRASG